MTQKTKTKSRRNKLTGGDGDGDGNQVIINPTDDVVTKTQNKITISIDVNDIIQKVKTIIQRSNNKLSQYANEIGIILLAEIFAKKIAPDLLPNTLLENSQNPAKLLMGGSNIKNIKKTKKYNKTKKNIFHGGQLTTMFFLTLLAVMTPLVQSGINNVGFKLSEIIDSGKQALSAPIQEGRDVCNNALGICQSHAALFTGFISPFQFGEGIKKKAVENQQPEEYDVEGYPTDSTGIGHEAGLSHFYNIDILQTQFELQSWDRTEKSIETLLGLAQQQMIEDRQSAINNGILTPSDCAATMLYIPGHAVAAWITPAGAFIVRNTDDYDRSMLFPGNPFAFMFKYKPPVGGMSPEAEAEWNQLNKAFPKAFGTLGDDTLTPSVFKQAKSKGYASISVNGIIGHDNPLTGEIYNHVINDSRTREGKIMHASKQINAASGTHLNVNFSPIYRADPTQPNLLVTRATIKNDRYDRSAGNQQENISKRRDDALDFSRAVEPAQIARSQSIIPEDRYDFNMREQLEEDYGPIRHTSVTNPAPVRNKEYTGIVTRLADAAGETNNVNPVWQFGKPENP